MKIFAIWLAFVAFALPANTDKFIASAAEKHGDFGGKAARFLVANIPQSDMETLSTEFLTENLDLALKARETFPWAKEVPEKIFLNDVLPYAVFDEPRDPWRADFLKKATPLVKDAETASEAAQILNRDFFKLIDTHYHTKRNRPNQSPKKSIAQGRATCTGLSIILVDVCRAVGIPARAVGTPLWYDDSGNHTWVEIWDDGWHFTEALSPGRIIDVRTAALKPVPVLDEDDTPISKQDAPRAIQLAYETLIAGQEKNRANELEEKSITIGDHTLKWLEESFGEEPKDGRSLWISMHGGGGAPAPVNDQQWQNQIKLYQPKEGIYLAPRAPTNTWNLWHEAHIDPLFARLIESMIALRNVNPNKIYLMGYSAGGDGVWQLAPRMADRFAAASTMAGHPNESSLLGLRNLPFAIFMGENDSAYDRNKIAAEKTTEIKALQTADPNGYTHMSRIYEGLGHWMKLKDAEALPWMEKFIRNPWPKKIVWFQDDVTHSRFYWLRIPEGAAEKGQKIVATVEGQKIHLEGDVPKDTRILLSDELLDLDKPVEVTVNDQSVRKFEPIRSAGSIRSELAKYLDPLASPTAVILLGSQ